MGYAADAANHRVAATVVETVVGADGTPPRGTRKRVLTYDVVGDLVESAENPDGTADGRSEARYAYDGGGLLKTVTVENGTDDHTTSFAHDAAGNRDSATGPDFGTRSFEHTALGELRRATDGLGGVTAWTYDLLGRPRTRTDPGGGTASWTWDTAAVGLPAGRSYDDSATTAVEYEETYAYDADARPTAATTTVRPTATSTETFTRAQTYDANGRPARTTHASGVAVDYEYNARGYLSKLKHGAAALVTYAGADAWGNPTGETYGNGVSTARTFDPATGRVTEGRKGDIHPAAKKGHPPCLPRVVVPKIAPCACPPAWGPCRRSSSAGRRSRGGKGTSTLRRKRDTHPACQGWLSPRLPPCACPPAWGRCRRSSAAGRRWRSSRARRRARCPTGRA